MHLAQYIRSGVIAVYNPPSEDGDLRSRLLIDHNSVIYVSNHGSVGRRASMTYATESRTGLPNLAKRKCWCSVAWTLARVAAAICLTGGSLQ
jgi:hypothetical protein